MTITVNRVPNSKAIEIQHHMGLGDSSSTVKFTENYQQVRSVAGQLMKFVEELDAEFKLAE